MAEAARILAETERADYRGLYLMVGHERCSRLAQIVSQEYRGSDPPKQVFEVHAALAESLAAVLPVLDELEALACTMASEPWGSREPFVAGIFTRNRTEADARKEAR